MKLIDVDDMYLLVLHLPGSEQKDNLTCVPWLWKTFGYLFASLVLTVYIFGAHSLALHGGRQSSSIKAETIPPFFWLVAHSIGKLAHKPAVQG